MDNITVDLGHEPAVEVGAPATLIGIDGGQRQTAEDLARRLGHDQLRGAVWRSPGACRALYHRDGVEVGRRGDHDCGDRAAAAAPGRSPSVPGSWAAPCATSCSDARRPTTTSRSRGTRGSRRASSARRAGAHAFALSDTFGAWRVVARDRSWQVDLTPLMGDDARAGSRRRDLTINAIARPLGGGELIDPFGGVADLEPAAADGQRRGVRARSAAHAAAGAAGRRAGVRDRARDDCGCAAQRRRPAGGSPPSACSPS